jgi:hypothetical protein
MSKLSSSHQLVFSALLLAVIFAGPGIARAGSEPGTPSRSPVLVELFTSEGCSSCPPADRLLQKLDESQPVQNADTIVLSEHVDYWNHEGWRDPYSNALFTQRQQLYAARFGLNDVYTPQMVVNGRTQFVGNDSHRATEAIAGSTTVPSAPVHISPVTVENGVVKFRVDANVPPLGGKAPEVVVVLAYERATSRVTAGENSGRELTHVAVAHEFTKVGVIPRAGSFSKDVQLKLSKDWHPGNIRVIAFLQEPGQGAVLGAAMQRVAAVGK